METIERSIVLWSYKPIDFRGIYMALPFLAFFVSIFAILVSLPQFALAKINFGNTETEHLFTEDETFACIQDDVMGTEIPREENGKIILNNKISLCLEQYGNYILRDEGKIAKEFYNQDDSTPEGIFNEYARTYGLNPESFEPLSSFRIKVPVRPKNLEVSTGELCYNYAIRLKPTRKALILDLKHQIEQAGQFLAHHHALSGGTRNSWFFNLEQINICSPEVLNDRYFIFSKHHLNIGMQPGVGYPHSYNDIAEAWANDNIIRRHPWSGWTSFYTGFPLFGPFVGETVRAGWVNVWHGKEGVIADLLAEKWELVFNPTSTSRSHFLMNLIVGITKIVKGDGILSNINKKIITESSQPTDVESEDGEHMKEELIAITNSGPGLRSEGEKIQQLDPAQPEDLETINQIYTDYIKTVDDRFTTVEMIEAGIAESMVSSNPLYSPSQTNTFSAGGGRTLITILGAALANQKDISVGSFFASFIPPTALSLERFRRDELDLAKEAENKIAALIDVVIAAAPEGFKESLQTEMRASLEKGKNPLTCGEHDTEKSCSIKSLFLGFASSGAMYYEDGKIKLVRHVKDMDYDIDGPDWALVIGGFNGNLEDDVDIVTSLSRPSFDLGVFKRYSLGKAVEGKLHHIEVPSAN